MCVCHSVLGNRLIVSVYDDDNFDWTIFYAKSLCFAQVWLECSVLCVHSLTGSDQSLKIDTVRWAVAFEI